MEFNIRQQNIINSKAKNILCLAAAASGKTRTIIGRIQRFLDMGEDPSKIVCFSFTNQAAEEMKMRLQASGHNIEEMFIGTIHSYANHICQLGEIDTTDYIVEDRFDALIVKALDVSFELYPHIQHLFVDEFQDTDPLQYEFIKRLYVDNRFYVGDERQFIYSFRGASDQYIRVLATDDDFEKYYLTENYRNPYNIMEFANQFIKNMEKISPVSTPTITDEGFLDKCSFKDVMEEMTWKREWKEWTVLCRTNQEIETVQKLFKDSNVPIPYIVIRRGDFSLKALTKAISKNRVKIMTIHAAKGLEFSRVAVIGARNYNSEEQRISYVAATRAKESLYWCPALPPIRSKGREGYKGGVLGKTSLKSIQF